MKHNTRQLLDNAVLEALEGRDMMSVTPLAPSSLTGGVLTITGSSAQPSRVVVDLANQGQTVTVDVSGQRSTFPTAQVFHIDITTGSGADYIYVNPAIDIPESINSGDGNDTIRTGGGDVTVVAGNGNDEISTKGDDNHVQAGNGNDVLLGNKGNNTLVAGSGDDYFVSEGSADLLTAGNGNDTFIAGDGHDSIDHGSGQDVFEGASTNSYVYVKPSGGTSGGSNGATSGSTGITGGSTTTNGGSTTTNGGSTTTGGGSTTTGGGSTTTGGGSTTTTGGSGSTTNGSTGGTGSGGTKSTTGASSSLPAVINPEPPVPTFPAAEITVSPGAVAPVPVITQLAGPRFTGLVVNVDGLSSVLNAGTPITSNYAWNFGDPNGANDQMTGYNAAHVYDTAGSYTITLTVTNSEGAVASATQQVTIAAAQRTQIYVDSEHGSDSNNGSANAPLQSLAAAFAKVGDNTEILLEAGETFYTDKPLDVNNTNVLIGRYGTGANPVIMRTLGNGLPTISMFGNANGVTIQDITVNSPYPSTSLSADKIGLGGFFLAGTNVCVRDCTFENVDDAINENGNPVGVLIQDNSAPLAVGLRGYMVWGQGSEQVIIGNYAANTTKEHIVRLVGLDMVTVEANNFTNHDGKGCIEMHEGEYGWIVDNAVDGGDIRVGPLGLWGESASSQTDWVKIEDNQLTDTFIYVQSGTHHAMIDNNVIIRGGAQAIAMSGVDSQGRTSMDITIENNTAIDTGTNSSMGNFLQVGGYVDGIVLKDNLWVAPQLVVGSYGSAPVYVDQSNLSDFTEITGNIWPSPVTLGTYANGGINFVGTSMVSSGYLTPAQWNAQSNVGTDEFENLTLNGSYGVASDSMSIGASLKLAA